MTRSARGVEGGGGFDAVSPFAEECGLPGVPLAAFDGFGFGSLGLGELLGVFALDAAELFAAFLLAFGFGPFGLTAFAVAFGSLLAALGGFLDRLVEHVADDAVVAGLDLSVEQLG